MVFYNLIKCIHVPYITYIGRHILCSISKCQFWSFNRKRNSSSPQILGRRNFENSVVSMIIEIYIFLIRWKSNCRKKVDNLFSDCYAECNFYYIKHLLSSYQLYWNTCIKKQKLILNMCTNQLKIWAINPTNNLVASDVLKRNVIILFFKKK